MPKKIKVRDEIFSKILSAALEIEKALIKNAPEPLTLKELLQGVKCHIDLANTFREKNAPAVTTRKNLTNGKFTKKYPNLVSEVLEINSTFQSKDLTRSDRAQKILDRLLYDVSFDTIYRILKNNSL